MIIYFAVSSKSSRPLRLAAFAALALIAIAIAVSGVVLIIGPGEGPEIIPFPFLPDTDAPPAENGNTGAVIIFMLVFLLILGLVIWLHHREQRKKEDKSKTAKDFKSSRSMKNWSP